MILCCPICGNSFQSNDKNAKCDYCFNNTEVLFSDYELESIPQEEILVITTVTKEKYKSEDNPKYNPDMWSAREARDENITKQEKTKKEQEKIRQFNKNVYSHMTTTGFNFEGYKITKYISVISGNVVLGTGLLTDASTVLNDFLGTTSNAFENKMEKAKSIAVQRLIEKSAKLGGNAIISIDFDFFTVGNNMIAVSANGTSVVIEEIK